MQVWRTFVDCMLCRITNASQSLCVPPVFLTNAETVLALLRNPDYCVYGLSTVGNLFDAFGCHPHCSHTHLAMGNLNW